jgi:hypothetical protein
MQCMPMRCKMLRFGSATCFGSVYSDRRLICSAIYDELEDSIIMQS